MDGYTTQTNLAAAPNRIVRGVLGAATLLVLAAVAFDWLAPVLLGA